MKIETKYNIGQEVWVNDLGEPHQFYVEEIDIWVDRFRTNISYRLKDNMRISITMLEYGLFPTKEELLKSL